MHEQTACSFIFRHMLFGPHGDGLHGSFGIRTVQRLKIEELEETWTAERCVNLSWHEWKVMKWIPSSGEHITNALPDILSAQLQVGMWFTTEHKAFWPQIWPERHGSWHLFLMQARSLEQSEFRTHSGRQPKNGSPWYSGRQTHTPLMHCVFAPQFKHGSVGLIVVSKF